MTQPERCGRACPCVYVCMFAANTPPTPPTHQESHLTSRGRSGWGPTLPPGAAEPSAAPEANTPADVLAVPGSAPGGRGGGLLWAGERRFAGFFHDGGASERLHGWFWGHVSTIRTRSGLAAANCECDGEAGGTGWFLAELSQLLHLVAGTSKNTGKSH